MNKFKLDVHSKQTFKLTIENVDEHIGRKNPWFQCINGRDGWFAVCPICNNPIQIIGMINRDRLYGRHFTPQPNDIRYRIRGIVDHNERDFCPYYAGRMPIDKTTRRPPDNELTIAIKSLLIEQFDRVIYLLGKTSGIKISLKLAKQMLTDYKNNAAWRYMGASLDNIPWTFAYFQPERNLFGRYVTDAKLRELLIVEVPFLDIDANGLVKNKTGGLISLKYDFVHHKQELEGDNLIESIELRIMNKGSVILRKKIECEQDYFNNLINSKQEDKRQMEFVELAREILG